MKIYIGKLVLADDSLGRLGPGVSGFDSARAFNQQVAEYIRAVEVENFDRGNVRTQLAFSTHQQFESHVEAEAWCLEAHTEIPTQGDVTVFAGGTSRFVLVGAFIDLTRAAFTGVTVHLSFRISGGRLARALPPTEA